MVALNRNLGLRAALNVDKAAIGARIQHLEPFWKFIHVLLRRRSQAPDQSAQIIEVELHSCDGLLRNVLHHHLVPVICLLPHSP